MKREEILEIASVQLDGFESYIKNLSNLPGEPIINEDEKYDFMVILSRIWVHLEDLRQDLDRLSQF